MKSGIYAKNRKTNKELNNMDEEKITNGDDDHAGESEAQADIDTHVHELAAILLYPGQPTQNTDGPGLEQHNPGDTGMSFWCELA
jgi:hypothetical protein